MIRVFWSVGVGISRKIFFEVVGIFNWSLYVRIFRMWNVLVMDWCYSFLLVISTFPIVFCKSSSDPSDFSSPCTILLVSMSCLNLSNWTFKCYFNNDYISSLLDSVSIVIVLWPFFIFLSSTFKCSFPSLSVATLLP